CLLLKQLFFVVSKSWRLGAMMSHQAISKRCFQANNNKLLNDHLVNCDPRTRYASHKNDLIGICGQIINGDILSRCNHAGVIGFMVDEVTDAATMMQTALCVRFLDPESDEIHEGNEDEVWNSLFRRRWINKIAGDVDVIPAAPRGYGSQQSRSNAPGNTCEEKRNMFLPFVEHLLVELETRLMQGLGGFCVQKLLPLKNDDLPRESIDDMYQAFNACLDVDETISVRECDRWRGRTRRWRLTDQLPRRL
ncbi:hypothetical protein MAR_011185, partial [Mya arenaria]